MPVFFFFFFFFFVVVVVAFVGRTLDRSARLGEPASHDFGDPRWLARGQPVPADWSCARGTTAGDGFVTSGQCANARHGLCSDEE